MKTMRSEIAKTLSKYATFVYDGSNPFRAKFGSWMFELAAWVSPK